MSKMLKVVAISLCVFTCAGDVFAGAEVSITTSEVYPYTNIQVHVIYGACLRPYVNSDLEFMDVSVDDDVVNLDLILGPDACPPGMGMGDFDIGQIPEGSYTLVVNQVTSTDFPVAPDERIFIAETDLVVQGDVPPIPALGRIGLVVMVLLIMMLGHHFMSRNSRSTG